jgi:hypothetical protein
MMSVNYGSFLDSPVNGDPSVDGPLAPAVRICPLPPWSKPVSTTRLYLIAALAFALPFIALAASPAMAATHKKTHHVLHQSIHRASTHHAITHRRRTHTLHAAAH